MTVAGTEHLTRFLHVIGQSLLIPCLAILLYFVLQALLEAGTLLGELGQRRKSGQLDAAALLSQLRQAQGQIAVLPLDQLPPTLAQPLARYNDLAGPDLAGQRPLARTLLEEQENLLARRCEKTELIAKMGPLMGLMGTLIPLGPGLVGLGKGDFSQLASYLIVSFDATIVGIFAGGIAFCIAKVRRRWYGHDLAILEALLETAIEVKENVAPEIKKLATSGRRI
ncbi:MAG: MotA/TolQ/ExbB proton channel family protein [Desulfurispora sp.]|uniref:MotA/TolQ/ExbB proton channel family protein n=1 Tax=Desulfurispora sp. TaxID=3014275 RepID=UPI00404989C1